MPFNEHLHYIVGQNSENLHSYSYVFLIFVDWVKKKT